MQTLNVKVSDRRGAALRMRRVSGGLFAETLKCLQWSLAAVERDGDD